MSLVHASYPGQQACGRALGVPPERAPAGKGLPDAAGPSVCVLDPDGDIVRHLRSTGQAIRCETWPCYHTRLDTFTLEGRDVGIIGCAVGAPFAALVAEELFASGCHLLLSLTSASQISAIRTPLYFVIIDRALRDEGTSYHYASAADYAEADPSWVALARRAAAEAGLEAIVGATWTTDAPFRETADAIAAAKEKGMLGVEMEAAAPQRGCRLPRLCRDPLNPRSRYIDSSRIRANSKHKLVIAGLDRLDPAIHRLHEKPSSEEDGCWGQAWA